MRGNCLVGSIVQLGSYSKWRRFRLTHRRLPLYRHCRKRGLNRRRRLRVIADYPCRRTLMQADRQLQDWTWRASTVCRGTSRMDDHFDCLCIVLWDLCWIVLASSLCMSDFQRSCTISCHKSSTCIHDFQQSCTSPCLRRAVQVPRMFSCRIRARMKQFHNVVLRFWIGAILDTLSAQESATIVALGAY